MLEELIATIETLKDRIKEHRSYFDHAAPEARTRVSLIDPLLSALEWDVSNPSLVEIEPNVANGRADYALLRDVGTPVLLLEAKKLSDTGAHHGQLASYVVGENLRRSDKIPYCGITNGSRWQVFDVLTQDRVLDISVERENPKRCALRFLGLWAPALREGGAIEPLVDLRRQDDTEDLPRPIDPSGDWTPLDSKTMNPSRLTQPSEIRFPDGSISKVNSWTDMLVATAEWLSSSGMFRREEMPFSVAGSRYSVSADGRHPDGTSFTRPLRVGETGLQIEGNFTGRQIVRFAVDLLKRCNQKPSEVVLKLRR
ncbi:MAG: hypothetical protein OXH52_01515 [Gammaproteobacteria bacterium]|nr:hypothetical protein [Gammaproteobacteria bacterium]